MAAWVWRSMSLRTSPCRGGVGGCRAATAAARIASRKQCSSLIPHGSVLGAAVSAASPYRVLCLLLHDCCMVVVKPEASIIQAALHMLSIYRYLGCRRQRRAHPVPFLCNTVPYNHSVSLSRDTEQASARYWF